MVFEYETILRALEKINNNKDMKFKLEFNIYWFN